MVNAFFGGIIISFAFLGLIFSIFYITLCFYKPSVSCKCMIYVDENVTKNELCDIMQGIYLKSLVYSDSVYENTIIVDALNDSDLKLYLKELSKGFNNINIITPEEIDCILLRGKNERKSY